MNIFIVLFVLCTFFNVIFSHVHNPQQFRSYHSVHELRSEELPGRIGLAYTVPRCDESFCEEVGDGIHRWASCSQFYCMCQRGQPSIQICSTGKFFDPIKNICNEAQEINFCKRKNFFKHGLA